MNNRQRTTPGLLLTTLVLVLAAACYGPADTTVYEPGVYKGADDPLLAKSASDEHAAVLRERMETVQTDR